MEEVTAAGRKTLRKAYKSCSWAEQREDRKAGESTKQVGRVTLCKTLKKSWTFIQVAEKMSFCALSSKPGGSQAALLSSRSLHHNFSAVFMLLASMGCQARSYWKLLYYGNGDQSFKTQTRDGIYFKQQGRNPASIAGALEK